MIKIILSVVLLSSTFIFAGEYTAQDRIRDMKELENAMVTIQKGFLYNDLATIEKGVEEIKQNAMSVEPPLKGEEKYLAKQESYSYKFAKRQSAKMIVHADDIVHDYKEGHKKQAVNVYHKIFKQCMTCHERIRNW
jgi:cytochrome c556